MVAKISEGLQFDFAGEKVYIGTTIFETISGFMLFPESLHGHSLLLWARNPFFLCILCCGTDGFFRCGTSIKDP